MAGPVRIAILANASQASREFRKTSSDASSMGSKVSSAGKTIAKVGLLAGGAAAAGVGALFVSGIKDAVSYQKLLAQTNSVIKSTKGVANVSAKGVSNLANKIAGYSDGNDDAVQSAENLLLTFTNVRNEAGKGNKIFNLTTKAAVDMSTALGTDASSAAMQLGKALNDPEKGVTKLARSGVTFTAQQTKQIAKLQESGHALKAQKIILGEVNKEFGGSARAAGATFAGSLGRLKDAGSDLIRDALIPLLPKLTKFADFLTKKGLPAAKEFAGILADKLAAASERVRSAFEKVQPIIEAVVGFIQRNPETVKAFAITLGILAGALVLVTAATAAWDAVLAVNPVTVIVLAIAVLVAALVYLNKKFSLITKITGFFKTSLGKARGIVAGFTGFFTKTIPHAVSSVISFVKSHWPLIIAILAGPIGLAVLAVTKNLDKIKTAFNNTVDFVKGIPGRIRDLVGNFRDAGGALIQGLVEGLKNVGGSISDIGKAIANSLIGFLNDVLPHTLSIDKGPIHVHVPLFPTIPQLAHGGIAYGPTLALIGEAGPEAVVPLGNNFRAGNTYKINVTAPVGADAYTIGEQIVTYIEEFEAGAA